MNNASMMLTAAMGFVNVLPQTNQSVLACWNIRNYTEYNAGLAGAERLACLLGFHPP